MCIRNYQLHRSLQSKVTSYPSNNAKMLCSHGWRSMFFLKKNHLKTTDNLVKTMSKWDRPTVLYGTITKTGQQTSPLVFSILLRYGSFFSTICWEDWNRGAKGARNSGNSRSSSNQETDVCAILGSRASLEQRHKMRAHSQEPQQSLEQRHKMSAHSWECAREY